MGIIFLNEMMERAAVFIDGGYLNKVLKDCFSEADIDYGVFSRKLCDIVKCRLLRTYFYHCMPVIRKGNREDEIRHTRMQKFIQKLKRLPRFEVKLGKLQIIKGVFKQKMVDVLMSLDIADISFERHVDHIIIVAGDSDFVPAIRKAKQYGVIVHLFYHQNSVHNQILDEVDERYEINEEIIEYCKKQN